MAGVDEMKCQEFVERTTDHLDGALSARDRERVLHHLDDCFGCEHHLDQVRATVLLAGALGSEPLRVSQEVRLLALHRSWARNVRT